MLHAEERRRRIPNKRPLPSTLRHSMIRKRRSGRIFIDFRNHDNGKMTIVSDRKMVNCESI
jgi:DNA primase